MPCPGVVLIRSTVPAIDRAHQQLAKALDTQVNIEGVFIIVEESRYRIRRTASGA
jgi:hypothetical protein